MPRKNYVLNQSPLDPTAGPLTDAVRVDQQREHDLGIVGGATATVGPIADTEVRKIELGDHVQEEPRQVVVRQPVSYRERHEHQLLTIRRYEVVSHATILPKRHRARCS